MTSPNHPPNYVATQRSYNAGHTDGSVENDDDGALALDFVEWIEGANIHFNSILVVGCRTGYEVSFLRGHWPEAAVIGVDIVPEFVKQANKRGRTVLVADMHSLPFQSGLFDLVFSSGALEHAYDAGLAASEMLRVSRRAVFCDAELDSPSSRENPSHRTFYATTEEWAKLFQRGIWRVESRHIGSTALTWAYINPDDRLDLSKLRGDS